MKTKLLVTVSALILSGSMAFAQASEFAEARITALQAEGYSRLEVKTGLTQTKIEAIDLANNKKLEIVIDSATGVVLSEEISTIGIFENTTAGVFYRTRNRDFVEADDNGADTSDDSDDDNSDDDNSDDDNGADTSGNSSDDDSSGSSSSSGNDDN
jgi:hypothetical protein